jgi:hypothetical protein
MVPFRCCNVIYVEGTEVVGKGVHGTAGEADQNPPLAPSGHKHQHTVCPFGKRIGHLQATLRDVPVGASLACPSPTRQGIHAVVGVPRVGKLKQALQVNPGNVDGPSGRGGLVEMPAKVPAQAQFGHGQAGAFCSPLHRLVARI